MLFHATMRLGLLLRLVCMSTVSPAINEAPGSLLKARNETSAMKDLPGIREQVSSLDVDGTRPTCNLPAGNAPRNNLTLFGQSGSNLPRGRINGIFLPRNNTSSSITSLNNSPQISREVLTGMNVDKCADDEAAVRDSTPKLFQGIRISLSNDYGDNSRVRNASHIWSMENETSSSVETAALGRVVAKCKAGLRVETNLLRRIIAGRNQEELSQTINMESAEHQTMFLVSTKSRIPCETGSSLTTGDGLDKGSSGGQRGTGSLAASSNVLPKGMGFLGGREGGGGKGMGSLGGREGGGGGKGMGSLGGREGGGGGKGMGSLGDREGGGGKGMGSLGDREGGGCKGMGSLGGREGGGGDKEMGSLGDREGGGGDRGMGSLGDREGGGGDRGMESLGDREGGGDRRIDMLLGNYLGYKTRLDRAFSDGSGKRTKLGIPISGYSTTGIDNIIAADVNNRTGMDRPTGNNNNGHKGIDSLAVNSARSGKEVDESAGRQKEVDDSAGRQKEVDESAGRQKEVDESAGKQKEVDESAGKQKEVDDSAGKQKEVDESAGKQKEVDESAGKQKEVDESASKQKEVDESASKQKEIFELTSKQKEVAELTSKQKEVDELTSKQKEVDESVGKQKEVDNLAANSFDRKITGLRIKRNESSSTFNSSSQNGISETILRSGKTNSTSINNKKNIDNSESSFNPRQLARNFGQEIPRVNESSDSEHSSCNCDWTCQLYGTCCEECQLEMLSEKKVSNLMDSSVIECASNKLLVSACVQGVDGDQWDKVRLLDTPGAGDYDAGSAGSWWDKYVRPDISYAEVKHRCEKSHLHSGILHNAPISDAFLKAHYKNIFCAICQNASSGTFWTGYASCEASFIHAPEKTSALGVHKNPPSLSSSVKYHPEADKFTRDRSCQLTWLPLREAPERVSSDASGSASATKEEEEQQRGIQRSLLDSHVTRASGNRVREDNDSSRDPGEALVGHARSNQSASGYQAGDHKTMCLPPMPLLPDNGRAWYTIQHMPSRTETGFDEWNITEGIEQTCLEQILELNETASCDQHRHIFVDGICTKISFTLRLKMTSTFDQLSIIKRNYRQEVIRYIDHVTTAFQGPLSNSTFCQGTSSTYSPLQGSSHIFNSQVDLNCAHLQTYDPAPSTKATTLRVTGNADDDAELARYADYVMSGFSKLLSDSEAVKLPVTIDYHPCVTLGYVSPTEGRCYCMTTSNSWGIQRRVDAIFGRISLEALISIICCVLSNIGLLARLVLQRIVPFYNTYPGKVQFCLCLSLLCAYSFFLMGGITEDGTRPCKIVAVITHLCFLSAILWMNVTAFEIWRTFRQWSSQLTVRGMASLLGSAVYATGIPVLMVTAALVLDEMAPWSEFAPSYGKPSCWLNATNAVALFFVGPCCFISFVNVIFVVLTLRGLRQQRAGLSEFRKSRNSVAVTDTSIVVKIVFLVGITWLFGLLAAFVDNNIIWITYTILNASLGFFISVVLVLNRRVFSAVRTRFNRFKEESTTISNFGSSFSQSFKR